MKKAKKVISIVLVATLLFSLVGCDKPDILEKISLKNIFKIKEIETTTENTLPVSETSLYTESVLPVDGSTQANTTEESASATQSTKNSKAPAKSTPKPTEKKPSTTQKKPTVTESGYGIYNGTYASIGQVVYFPNSIKSSKSLPVISFANGTGFSYNIYEKLLISIAESGYIVVANEETMSADGTAQIQSIDFVLSENGNQNSPLYKKVNSSQIGVMGHSQGGRSSVNAAVKDSRIKCVVSLAGSNYLEEAESLKTPALFMTGTSDIIVSSSQWVKPAYDVAKGPAVYASLSKGVHTTYCTNPEKCTYYCAKWFDAYLKNDKNAKNIFKNGGEFSQDTNWVDFDCKKI